MTSRFGRYAAAMTLLAVGACGNAQGRDAAETVARDAPTTDAGAAVTPESPPAPATSQTPAAPQTQQLDLAHLGFDRGSRDAPVRVVEMSDYGCGYCRKFHMETWPVLRKEFIETGKIQWKFLPFILGIFPNSMQATTAAECTLEQGSDYFEAMNQRLWEDQHDWKSSSDAAGVLRGWVAQLGLDTARYDSCVHGNRVGSRIAAANTLTRRAGVRGTPTFFILGYPPLQGALPTDAFRQVLSAVYKEAVKDSAR